MTYGKEYFPILKLKQGEITAFKRLNSSCGTDVSPIFDAWPVDMSGVRAKAIGYCASIATRVHQLLPLTSFSSLFIDPTFAISGAVSETPNDVCDALFHTPHKDPKKKLKLVQLPVYRASTPASAFSSMDKAAIRGGKAIIRLTIADTSLPHLGSLITALFSRLGNEVEIGLLIDAEDRVSKPVPPYAVAYENAFRSTVQNFGWSKVIVGSGSMPMTLSTLKPPGGIFERLGFRFFEEMALHLDRPVFMADYTSIASKFEELAFSNPAIAAKIKYLVDKDQWFIARAGVTNRAGGSLTEYKICAQTLISKPFFAGPAYSWAEKRIDDAASGADSPGQHVTWVSVAVVRHITKTAEDLSNLP